MSHDPENNHSDPILDFDEPDWLAELLAEAGEPSAETPRTQADPAPNKEAPRKSVSTDWQEEAPPARRPANPASHAAARPKTPPTDWEQTRRSGHSAKPNAPARRSSSARRRRRTNIPVILLTVVLVGGMLFAAWQLGSIFLGYSRDRSAYNELAANALAGMGEKEEPDVIISDTEVLPDLPEATPFVSELPAEVQSVDWDYLRSINGDIVGWLYCPDTIINYPVVQSPDHDYYLDHSFYGDSNSAGTLFADRDSVAGVTQSNLIIYGHNMKDESMFGTLKGYVDKSYYDKHPVFYYLTPTQSYRVELLCAHIVDATDENFPTYFSSSQTQQSYLNNITSNSYWINHDAVSTEYQLITFSTCTSSAGKNDPRFLVHGIMIPIQ